MKKLLTLLLLIFSWEIAHSQTDSTKIQTNLDAQYNRPFIFSANLAKTTTSIGGYMEGNTNYFATNGVPDGFSMEMRRFNIFLYSNIAPRIRLLSEIEFEHGTKEINLEAAFLDVEIHPTFTFRGGIILAPIGAFNQNHDAPKWDFIDRPLVSTEIIPSTLSEIGFGIYGKYPYQKWIFTYEAYLVNGLQDGVILNDMDRTHLPSGKNPDMFSIDNNATPSYTSRIAARHRKFGEIGLSAYNGIYNTFKKEGLPIDEKRSLTMLAADFSINLYGIQLNGEFVKGNIDIPPSLTEFYGNKQTGFYTDLIVPAFKKKKIWNWENAQLNICLRFEKIDYNVGKFAQTNLNIGDEITAISPGISFRPSPTTTFRFNYRYEWISDILNNPPSNRAGFQFGLATYF